MTCQETRRTQLDSLRNGIDELKFCVDRLNCSFLPCETFSFDTMNEAKEKYCQLERNGYKPGFLRLYAVVPFSIYDK